ncbi:MAG: imidazole glycerol phosphate synthase subunit HisH [Bacteroidia bacterium]|nr:imidazole glycerol phosphate synthase subunit HisH [Bacteroidia bacterium]MCO5254587.1 imidazole glycerol phosphate synthase subunit HisH [Bacteroidota bacterium]
MIKVGIIDYGMGNLLSLSRALEYVGAKVITISEPEQIANTDLLVLPGVGAFHTGMAMLNKKRFKEGIDSYVNTGKPFMGICLGMQMLLTKGYEFEESKGLGLIEGDVLLLPDGLEDCKVPNINWHEIEEPSENKWKETILHNTNPHACFYFVHSFFAKPKHNNEVLANTEFGSFRFASAIKKDNVFGTQFHPEKSGKEGLNLLKTFLTL